MIIFFVADYQDCKFFAAIERLAKFANLIYHHEFFHFAAKCANMSTFIH